jgi:hypothetical protein
MLRHHKRDDAWTKLHASRCADDLGSTTPHAFLCNKSYARFFARRHYVRLNKAGMWFSSSTSQHQVNKSLKEETTLKL